MRARSVSFTTHGAAPSSIAELLPVSTDQLQHFRQHCLGREEFLCKATRLTTRARVIALHSAQRLDRLGFGGEELQSETARQMPLRPGCLHDAWPPAGKIGKRPVADPARRRLDHRGFGAAEFATR